MLPSLAHHITPSTTPRAHHAHALPCSTLNSNQNTSPNIGLQNGRVGLPSQSDHDLGNDRGFRLTSQNCMIGLSVGARSSTRGDGTMRRITVNDDVRVCECSGLESGVKGYVVSTDTVPCDGSGVPQLGLGHYRPLQRNELVVRDATGRLFTMFRNRLRRI